VARVTLTVFILDYQKIKVRTEQHMQSRLHMAAIWINTVRQKEQHLWSVYEPPQWRYMYIKKDTRDVTTSMKHTRR